jgi:hypothetical protein
MKTLGSVFIIICFFLFSSCKSSSSSPTGSGGFGGPGGGGGGGGTGSVTFGITQGPGQTQGGIIMYGTPSVAVTITNVNVQVPAANPPFNKDYAPPDITTVFPANQPAQINEFTGVASGQKWVFVFTGHIGTATGTAFSATSNYTVP